MSRRLRRHDALEEHVAGGFLESDLRKAASDTVLEDYLRLGSIEAIARTASLSIDTVRLALHYDIVQFRDSGHWPQLAAYLYEDESRTTRCCWVCAAVLPLHHSKRGRTRRYCSNACKQRSYRRRRDRETQPRRVQVSGRPLEFGIDL